MILEYHSGIIEANLDKTKKTLVENVDFFLQESETLALIGESGSGKTLIASSILKLLPENVFATQLKLIFQQTDLSKKKNIQSLLGNQIVYIPQNGHESLNPSLKVKHQLYDSLKKIKVPQNQLKRKAMKCLEDVGFKKPEEIMNQYPFELSGGMAQRVVIAIATCSNASLVIADEPTNGIENKSKYVFLDLLKKLFPQAAKLIITHDISVANMCDKIIVLCKGKIMEEGCTKDILHFPYHPYTKALLSSLVENGMHEIPKYREKEGSCPFYNRCVFVNEKCLLPLSLKKDEKRRWYCNHD